MAVAMINMRLRPKRIAERTERQRTDEESHLRGTEHEPEGAQLDADLRGDRARRRVRVTGYPKPSRRRRASTESPPRRRMDGAWISFIEGSDAAADCSGRWMLITIGLAS